MVDEYEVVVIGGGAAGLSGAVVLARSRRTVLVVDAGDPRNAAAGQVHNVLTRDGTPPARLSELGRGELAGYGGEVVDAAVTSVSRDGEMFRVDLAGRVVSARRLLVATGARDELPDVPGLSQRWGRDVLHCPYCHGWEVRDRRVGVLSSGPATVHQALLFRQLTDHVTVLAHRGPKLTAEQGDQLDALGIAVVEGEVLAVESTGDRLTGVRLTDGTTVACDAVVVAPICHARAELLAPLGLEPVEFRMGDTVMGTYVPAAPGGATSIPGLYVAGNVADVQAQVISAAAAGLAAGATINMDLITTDAAARVTAVAPPSRSEPAEWDERCAGADRIWSGQPNGALVDEVAGLPRGRVLDVGCGEGADAIWLASNGWEVTAIDVSRVALDRARAQAAAAGVEVTWVQHGLLDADLPDAGFDLVSAQYPALRRTAGHDAERALIGAVGTGGTLLVVHHDMRDRAHAREHGVDPDDWVSPRDVATLLGTGWRIDVDERRERTISGGAGAHHIHDVVLRATRLG